MINPVFQYWLINVYSDDKKSIVAVPKKEFPEIVDFLWQFQNIVFISIEATPACAELNKFSDDNEHYAPASERVLNIEFDDVEKDVTYRYKDKYYPMKAITSQQAHQIVDFINNNTDKHIVVHCRAGKSRSQAIVDFVLREFKDKYQRTILNDAYPCITPNFKVLRELNKIKREEEHE